MQLDVADATGEQSVARPNERRGTCGTSTRPPLPVEDGLAASGRMNDAAGGLGATVVRRMLERSSPGIANRGRGYAQAGQTVSLDFERGRLIGRGAGFRPDAVRRRDHAARSRRSIGATVRAPRCTTRCRAPVTDDPRRRARVTCAPSSPEYRILVDSPLTVRCNCAYRGVCKHLVALAYVAGERLDKSPPAVAALLGVTDADLADPELSARGSKPRRWPRSPSRSRSSTGGGRPSWPAPSPRSNRRTPVDAMEVLGRAARTVTPPRSVADALGLLTDDDQEPEEDVDA